MKILVLMPLDERYSYVAAELYKNLSDAAKDVCFCMPHFNEYQMATRKLVIGNDLPLHWNVATLGSIMKAREVYQLQNKLNKSFILIGNIDPSFKFDAIFNFQDPDADKEYQDLLLDKLYETLPELRKYLNFYNNFDSKMPLHNYAAAGKFISDYLETDASEEDIAAKYKEQIAKPHFI